MGLGEKWQRGKGREGKKGGETERMRGRAMDRESAQNKHHPDEKSPPRVRRKIGVKDHHQKIDFPVRNAKTDSGAL